MLSVIILSCQETELTEKLAQDPVDYNQINVKDGRLVFKNMDHFGSTAFRVSNGELPQVKQELGSLDFVSLEEAVLVEGSNTSDIFSELRILSADYMRLLLNSKNEVQIDNSVYVITNESTKTYTMDRTLVETSENSVGIYNPTTGSIDYVSDNQNARPAGEWAHDGIPPTLTSVWYRLIVQKSILVFYKHHIELRDEALGSDPRPKAEFFQFAGSVCLCQHIPSNLPPTYTYNVNSVEYLLGYSQLGYHNTYGFGYYLEWFVKPYWHSNKIHFGDSNTSN